MNQQIKEYDSLLDMLDVLQSQGASPREIAVRTRRYLEFKARRNAFPMRGTFELTPLCNLDCKMCYVHLTKRQLAQDMADLLPGKIWIHIMRQAIEMGMFEVTLTGGEAMLHPDFKEILLFLESENIDVNLKTNGLLLTEERVAFLKEHNLGSLQITLYGCDEESYERVTGYRGFALTMAAIERVRNAGIPLEVIITPNKYIWNDLEKLIRLVDSMGVQYSVNPGLIDPLKETGRAGGDHDLTIEQYIQMNMLMAEIKGNVLVPPCAEDIPQPGGPVRERVEGLACAAGRSVFSVTWRGMVHPCRMLEKISFDGLKVPFAEGWKAINEAVKVYPYPRECVGCEFEAVCPHCVIQHEYGAEPGHANPSICERARRMAAEGFYTRKKEG